MLEVFSISGLVNALVAISFGVLVIFKNWKDRNNQLFFLMTASLALWGYSYWQWLVSNTSSEALFWVRLVSIGSLFIPVFFFHWVAKLTKRDTKYRLLILGTYVFCFSISLFSFSPAFIIGVESKLIFPFWPIPGVLYSLYFFLIYSSLVAFSIYFLIRTYQEAPKKSELRGQIAYILIGAILGFGGGLTNFPLWYGLEIPPFGTFLVAIFPFALGYATLKYRLFSLKTIASEILIFFIVIILVIQTIVASSALEVVLRLLFLLIVAVFGYLLVRSVYGEVEAREQVEKLAKDLEVANEKLKELDKLKSEFVSIASHQLRSPLTAIKGYASLILEGSFGKAPTGIEEAVQKMFDASKHLSLIVEDFLNVSRIEQGRMKYEFADTDVEKLVKTVIDELKPSIERSKLEFSFTTDNKAPYVSKIDIGKIQQVITNLLDNSIKYTPQGSIKITVTKRPEKIIRIAIGDTGVGMTRETIATLFSKFTRANDANKVNVSGTGLGLYVAKQMVEAHGGKVWAESAGKGKGSTFFVELKEI